MTARRALTASPALAAVVAWQLTLSAPTPLGVLLLGAVMGSLNGLLGMGLVLIYRTNRIINFAHGAMGGLAAVLFVQLVFAGMPYVLALVVGLVSAGLVGIAVEMGVMRRFASAPRLLATVATIGLSQVLGAASLALPLLFDEQVTSMNFTTPLSRFEWSLSPVVFDGNYLLILVAVVSACVALSAFLRTRWGVAVRAAAENPDRAALSGIPIKSLATAVWGIAAVLSAAAAMLQAPVVGFRTGLLVGPSLLMHGLAAGVVGRMASLPVTLATAIGLGMFGQAVFWEYGNATVVDALALVVILGSFVVQRRQFGRLEASDAAWQAAAPLRPLPRRVAALPEVRMLNTALCIAVGMAVIAAPLVITGARRQLLTVVVIYAMVGLSLVVLTGWAGQISLGQFGIVGLAAAVAGSLTSRAGLDFAVGLAGGAATGVVVAVLLGLPALRIRGLFLAVTTLAFAVATSSFALTQEWLVPFGLVDRPALFGRFDLHSDVTYYYVCLALLALVVAALRSFRNSHVWRTIVSIRDNERAAQGFGVSPVAAKLTAFAISGAIAGLAGALLVHQQYRVQDAQYDAGQSLVSLTMTVIGGLGSIPGAIIGAVYVKGAQYFLPAYGALLTSGIGLLALLLVLPRGLGASMFDSRDSVATWLARRRGVEVADRGVDDGSAG